MSAATGLAIVGFLGLWIVTTAWVFVDAEENSSGSTARWGAIALLFGFTGAFIYYVVGRDEAGDQPRHAYE